MPLAAGLPTHRSPGINEFTALTGQHFRLDDGSRLRLASVEAFPAAPDDSTGPFSLLFEGAPAEAKSTIYPLHHPRLGKLDLLLTPVGPPDRHGRQPLEAVMHPGPVPTSHPSFTPNS